ncbi:MAG: hypothetical protein J5780_02705, partial [Treponema sp.]|nr:hypothetical protein [Treponema sp.]
LASRLEGTNKAYGSWIMVSGSTWEKADSGENRGLLVARKFDCVRVINVNKPVQIFNVLGLREELSDAQIKAAEIFNEGMDWYLKGRDTPEVKKDVSDLLKAMSFFNEASMIFPEDESSFVFIERCKKFINEGVPAVWDGVYTMESK